MAYTQEELDQRRVENDAELAREQALATAALPEILLEYPPSSEVAARSFKWYDRKKPTAADFEKAKTDLARDIAQYDDYRNRGGECLSHYDITIGAHGGVAALRQALMLKHAHISWNRGKLLWLEEQLGIQKGLF